MRRSITLILILLVFGLVQAQAQTASTSDHLVAQPIADRSVPFDVTDPGISRTVAFGADLAWANEQNFRRNLLFMGLDQVDLVRASFQPTYPLVNGTDLTQEQLDDLNFRIHLINTYVGPNTDLALNCDHPWVDEWYVGYPGRWEQLIETSTQIYLDSGHNVITVGAFNEPDYGWGQGTIDDFYNINVLLSSNPLFNGVRLSGGNTLNCDEAQSWYDYLVPSGVNEGNTHQLAGSFDGFASFYQSVRANGHHATGDELHNLVEALVGYEYGMQTGIWWADIDLASGELVKAFDGQRIGYAEHRPNWTAAAVYRTPEGKVQAFGGTSERQAVTTTYNYISKDRVVYYDGYGPQREFVLEMPGGTGYQSGQTNAERVINVTWGDDIQPVIDGRYMVVNRNSSQVMQVDGSTSLDGTNVAEGSYSGGSHQQWDVYPVDSRVGGDFSYFKFQPASNSTKYLDLNNFSLDNGGNIHQWSEGQYGNQQWYLDYAEDGWFYIRSRESSKCIDVDGTGDVIQWEKTGAASQQWRLLPVGTPIEFVAPGAPSNLVATAQAASIKLDWTASPESDVAGYTILRAESASGPYNTIARDVTAVSFVDNTTLAGATYYYSVRAEDHSLNRSANSNQVSAAVTGSNAIVTEYGFENNTLDASVNLNHSASFGSPAFGAGEVGSGAVNLDGTDDFIQLPADIASHQEITMATWVYWNGGGAWQRIFDFGNGTSENMFLTPYSGSGTLRFAITNGGPEEILDATSLPTGEWVHVAVTLGSSEVRMYVSGQVVAESTAFTVSPLDFKPVQNYIGRSQYPDPLLTGSVDDFRVYNYALSASEIADLAGTSGGTATTLSVQSIVTGTVNAGKGRKYGSAEVTIYDDQSNPVAGANVTGTFSGTFNETVSGTTGTNGTVFFQTSSTASGGVTVDFCVDDVTHSSLTYDPAQNQITCTNGSARFAEDMKNEANKALNIYPIPAGDVLNISVGQNYEQIEVAILDLSGRSLLRTGLFQSHHALDISSLEPGIYIVKIQKGSEVMRSQQIIKR